VDSLTEQDLMQTIAIEQSLTNKWNSS